MGRKQTKLVKSQPLLVERHHKLWIPRAASGLSLLGLSPWTCRARATLLSWSLRCPPPFGLSLAPRGAARPGAAGTARRSAPRDVPAAETTPRSRPSTGSPLFPGTPAGTPGAGLGAQVPAGPGRVEDARAPRRMGREGEGCFCHGGLPGRCGGDPGGSLRHLCKRGREYARGVGGGGVTLRTPIWPGFAPVPEAKRQKSRLNAAAGLGAPFARPDSLQEPRASPGHPTLPFVFARAAVR